MGVTAGTCPEGRPVPSASRCRAPPSPVLLDCSSGLQRRQASSGQAWQVDWQVRKEGPPSQVLGELWTLQGVLEQKLRAELQTLAAEIWRRMKK